MISIGNHDCVCACAHMCAGVWGPLGRGSTVSIHHGFSHINIPLHDEYVNKLETKNYTKVRDSSSALRVYF